MRKLIIPLLFALSVSVPYKCFPQGSPPKLVVKIIVSQMRYDYLKRFGHNFTDTGLKRFTEGGLNFANARYDYMNSTSPAGIATITTGANPSMHGIVSESWVDFTTNDIVDVVRDEKYFGVGGLDVDGHYAPTNLTVSTVGDELKKHNGYSKVVSIALEPVSSVIAGGRTADAAYWFDTHRERWVTSTYYTERLPNWVENYNESGNIANFKDRAWSLTLLSSQYVYSDNSGVIKGTGNGNSLFSSLGGLLKKKTYDFDNIVSTPVGIDMIIDFARATAIYENLGQDEHPDLLVLTIDPTRTVSEYYGTESLETEDAYYRLDHNINYLVEAINARIGKDNVIYVLTSDHGSSDTYREDSKMPCGIFNVMQFRVLMNGFLNSQYGTDTWVIDYNNRSLYLNHRVIFDKGLSLAEVQANAAAFAMQFRGVAQAVTGTALQNNHFSGGALEKIQNGYYAKHSGDIVLNLMPGWIEDAREGVVSTGGSMYEYDTHVPLLWHGAGLGKEVIHTPVDMTDVAPTLSRILGINQPNAATGAGIVEITSRFKP